MRVLLIEDEQPAFNRLSKLIQELLPLADILGPVESVAEAEQWFKSNEPPAVLFCDIQLADGTAFDFIKNTSPNCPIIFTTAFSEYAIDAFSTTTIDYLLKPVKREHLVAALTKLKLFKELFQKEERILLHQTTERSEFKKRFVVRFGEHLKSVNIEDIAFFFSENKGTFIKTFEGKNLPVDNNLDALEQAIDPNRFFRLNRQFLVSLEAIDEMRTYSKGRVIVSLKPEAKEQPVVSSEKSAIFKQWLADEL